MAIEAIATSEAEFLQEHGEELKKLPTPEIAIKYYRDGDLYLFDEFH